MPRYHGAKLRALIFALGLTLLLPAVAHAQPATPPTDAQKAQARQRYDAGVRKFDVGRFEDAAADFEAAYELSGAPEILFNMATAYRAAKKYEKALLMYRAYLRRVPEAPQRAVVEARIAELAPIVKQQQLEKQRQEEEQRRQRELEEQQRLQQEQQRLQQEQGATTTPPAAPAAPRPLPRWVAPAGYAVGAVGIAGLGTGIALSLLARSASDTVQSAAASGSVFDSDLKNTEARGKAEDTGAIACYVVGGVLVAAGATMVIVAKLRAKRAEKVAVAPYVGPSGGGLTLAGSF